ncbi:MAG TPA: hypothetical protein VGH89_11950 [Pseudonocardia sp.]
MAKTGHAQDCPACALDGLPQSDREWFARQLYLPLHRRREPPPRPAEPRPRLVRHGGFGWTLIIFAVALSPVSPVIGAVVGAVGAAMVLGLFPVRWPPGPRNEQRIAQWRREMRDWEREQAEVWFRRRIHGLDWPCPACGRLDCQGPTPRVGSARSVWSGPGPQVRVTHTPSRWAREDLDERTVQFSRVDVNSPVLELVITRVLDVALAALAALVLAALLVDVAILGLGLL